MAESLSRKEIIAKTGIPVGSFRRELRIAGITRVYGDRGKRIGNIIEYRYPLDAVRRINESRKVRARNKTINRITARLRCRALHIGMTQEELRNLVSKTIIKNTSPEVVETSIAKVINSIKKKAMQ